MTPLQAELGLLKGKLAAAQNEADTLSRMPSVRAKTSNDATGR